MVNNAFGLCRQLSRSSMVDVFIFDSIFPVHPFHGVLDMTPGLNILPASVHALPTGASHGLPEHQHPRGVPQHVTHKCWSFVLADILNKRPRIN